MRTLRIEVTTDDEVRPAMAVALGRSANDWADIDELLAEAEERDLNIVVRMRGRTPDTERVVSGSTP